MGKGSGDDMGGTHMATGRDAPETLLVTQTPDEWAQSTSSAHQGLLVKRPFHGKYESLQWDIDAVAAKYARENHPCMEVANGAGLSERLSSHMSQHLRQYELPASLARQIQEDTVSIGCAVGRMCPWAPHLDIQ